jgi:hypothetical protein
MNGAYPRVPVRKLSCVEQRGWDMFVALIGEVRPQAIGTVSSEGNIYWVGPKLNVMADPHTPTHLAWSRVSDVDAVERGVLVMQAGATFDSKLRLNKFIFPRQPISQLLASLHTNLLDILPLLGDKETLALIKWE